MGVRGGVRRVSATLAGLALAAVSESGCGIAPDSVDSTRPTREDARPAAAEVVVPPSRAGSDRVGVPAPPFTLAAWIGSPPLSLVDLRGKVVLVRFFTDECPYCRATAPALKQLDEDFRARGLVVVGLFHPKPRGSKRPTARVEAVVDAWGWRFPVGLDADWTTLDAYWLASGDRSATSASFLVDQDGVIRWVHPGPEFHPGGPADHETCRRDYAELRTAIETLLEE